MTDYKLSKKLQEVNHRAAASLKVIDIPNLLAAEERSHLEMIVVYATTRTIRMPERE